MRPSQVCRSAARAVVRHPLQSTLIGVAVALATASIVVSLGLGEGAQRRVTEL